MNVRSTLSLLAGACLVSVVAVGGPVAAAQSEPKAGKEVTEESYGSQMKALEERQRQEIREVRERHLAERNALRQRYGKGAETDSVHDEMEKGKDKARVKEKEAEEELEKVKSKARDKTKIPDGTMLPSPEKGRMK